MKESLEKIAPRAIRFSMMKTRRTAESGEESH